jgi:response regulator RpfG family c-di-GMP phosphodiesterase
MSERILLVDDEPLVLEGLKRQLRKRVDIQTATSGRDGLALVDASEPFAVVVSDMRMPEMNGSQFLEQVRRRCPDTVRMILSGQAEIESTIAAVNLGQIFRFLTKPCSTENLFAALDSGIEQYRLVIAKRELLEKTLRGTVQVLTEILELTNPVAQQRAKRVERYAQDMCELIGMPMSWELRLAAMLSQIGCVSLPEDALARLYAGQSLAEEAQSVYQSHPRIAGKLLAGIPRLEGVAQIVAAQLDDFDFDGLPENTQAWDRIRLDALLLKTAADLDFRLTAGIARDEAARRLLKAAPRLPKPIAAAVHAIALRSCKADKILVKVSGLQIGMLLDEDLTSKNGMRLLPKGQEITKSILLRLQGFAESIGVNEPFRVTVAR